MADEPQDIGGRIKALRGTRTQTAFGDLYGASKQTVAHWEASRHNPKPAILLRMANDHGTSVEAILTGVGFRNSGKAPPPSPFQAVREELEIKDPRLMIRRSLKVLGIIDEDSEHLMAQIEHFARKAGPTLEIAKRLGKTGPSLAEKATPLRVAPHAAPKKRDAQ